VESLWRLGAKVFGPLIWSGMDSFIDIKVPKRLRKSEESYSETFQMVKMRKRLRISEELHRDISNVKL
jgi:hypothetical protein